VDSAAKAPDAENENRPAMEASEGPVLKEAPEIADAASVVVAAEPFGPGSLAPPIVIAKWVKGEPVESFSSGKVYVVEFWATWCGPCLRSMPHMASLQKEYGDKVTFIGVSDEDEQTVESFMKRESQEGGTWSEVLTYTIALDDEAQTNAAYMKAANQGGIPCAFVVGKTGNVEWIGHPMSMDEPLEQIVSGSWDSAGARKQFILETETERILNEYMPRLAGAANSGDFATAVVVCDEILEKQPGNARINQIRMSMLIQGNMIKELNETAARQVDENFDNSFVLNQVAWILADGVQGDERDLNLALKAAMRASELSKHEDASVLDTLARVFYEQGNLPEAIEWQKKATEADSSMKQLSETLAKYEAEANPSKAEEKPAEKTPAAKSAKPDESPQEEPVKTEEPAADTTGEAKSE